MFGVRAVLAGPNIGKPSTTQRVRVLVRMYRLRGASDLLSSALRSPFDRQTGLGRSGTVKHEHTAPGQLSETPRCAGVVAPIKVVLRGRRVPWRSSKKRSAPNFDGAAGKLGRGVAVSDGVRIGSHLLVQQICDYCLTQQFVSKVYVWRRSCENGQY